MFLTNQGNHPKASNSSHQVQAGHKLRYANIWKELQDISRPQDASSQADGHKQGSPWPWPQARPWSRRPSSVADTSWTILARNQSAIPKNKRLVPTKAIAVPAAVRWRHHLDQACFAASPCGKSPATLATTISFDTWSKGLS